jgi:crotonobetainyl-CoA:carnitine CoA-transferase CaiB-like acyl-CoA transferase
MSTMHETLPLADIKVVDFSRLLPGPWATLMFAYLGAEVIKVEQIGTGDPSRYNPPLYRDQSVYFHSVNAGKRSIAIDLSQPAGIDVAHKLLRWADVAVESYRPGVATKLKVEYDTAKSINPGIVYCSISGFGQQGPLSGIAGHDLVLQALSGLMKLHQDGSRVPGMPPFQAADLAAANMATIGILAALRRRDKTGIGCNLDIALLDSLVAMSQISLLPGLSRAAGGSGKPDLEAWGGNPRYAIYPAADGGYLAVGLLEAKAWHQFCQAIGRADLILPEGQEDRHSSHGERSELYRSVIGDYCGSLPRDAIAAEMARLAIPIAPVLSPDEAIAHENAKARSFAVIKHDPDQGAVTELTNPLKSSGLVRTEARGHAPGLGAHGKQVLSMLGFSMSEIDALRKEGVV